MLWRNKQLVMGLMFVVVVLYIWLNAMVTSPSHPGHRAILSMRGFADKWGVFVNNSDTSLTTPLTIGSPTRASSPTSLTTNSTGSSYNDSIQAILTLFTTFSTSESKRFIYENTIRIWHLLKPDIIPIMFTDSDPEDSKSIAHFATQHGWLIEPVPKTSPKGIPILRYMFIEAQRKTDTPFYCFANGDILFDHNLTDTVRFLQASAREGRIKQLLVVGRRHNWPIPSGVTMTTLSEVGHYTKSSTLCRTDAQDYFLTTRDGYPWGSIPDFVVGRVGYDNWLVVTAIMKQILVVDATATVTALHMSGNNSYGDGRKATSERYINYELAKGFDYSLGVVTCGHFATQNNGNITLKERKPKGTCRKRKIPPVENPFTTKG